MSQFTKIYNQLNDKQRLAVDTIDGPLLVIAGPGTGKTQLLSARVANILQKTDIPAQNILCLTFTENGSINMRERLSSFIAKDAYDVNIGTYHAFGGDLISRYPEYFNETRLQSPIDELAKRQVLLGIVESMDYDNPLKQTRHHIGDLIGTLSEVKRAMLTSDDLRKVATNNRELIKVTKSQLKSIFSDFKTMPRSRDKAKLYFDKTLAVLTSHVPAVTPHKMIVPLASLAAFELQAAIRSSEEQNKTTPLTHWKNKWLAKDTGNNFILAGELENRRITQLASILDQYHEALEALGLYDFDDMILRSIQALEKYPDFKYTLQERYLYILLDEFQDTNAAQLRLVSLLTDNPVHEGRPNVMAVGDDDQAIYAFQGAQYSNMLDFYNMYQDAVIISLAENYRSHRDILHTASGISQQIENRLQHSFEDMKKTLLAARSDMPDAQTVRREFRSEIAERAWIARSVQALIQQGTSPSEIAILSPKHKQLEPIVPYLNALDIPVRYEKRENILDTPIVRQIITMCRLIAAISENNQALASSLWPEVLSYDFWQIPIEKIWQLSWEISDSKDESASWTKAMPRNPSFETASAVILATATKTKTETCETILDYVIGSAKLDTHMGLVYSPLKDYYTRPDIQKETPELFYDAMSHLTVMRSKLRQFQDSSDAALYIADFLHFVSMYEDADQQLINTSPYAQNIEAVQLMTVFKAKGLEYQHVFLPSTIDDVWGAGSRGNTNKLTLPPNLDPIRHAGATDDERLRILFVAITRAKYGLYMTSAAHTYSGKPTKRLKYLDEQEQTDGSFRSNVLPAHSNEVHSDDSEAPSLKLLELDWQKKHISGKSVASLSGLLSGRLSKYRLSPTHLLTFLDLEYAGPLQFYFNTILRFPSAPTLDSIFGSSIHETLEWYQRQVTKQKQAPSVPAAIEYFKNRLFTRKLPEATADIELARGSKALSAYLAQRSSIFSESDVAEKTFYNENVFVGRAHMSGKIDRMEIDAKTRTITVVDYKTGKSYSTWKSKSKLHKYKLQLYAYKLLIEGSTSYKNYTVTTGRLEFVEPDSEGRINTLSIDFDELETRRVAQLLQICWDHVQNLDFPETGSYPVSLTGIKKFEEDLLQGKI